MHMKGSCRLCDFPGQRGLGGRHNHSVYSEMSSSAQLPEWLQHPWSEKTWGVFFGDARSSQALSSTENHNSQVHKNSVEVACRCYSQCCRQMENPRL